MKLFVNTFTSRFHSERGASMVEYGLLIALIVIVGMSAMGSVGSGTGDQFEVIAAGFDESGAPVTDLDQGNPGDDHQGSSGDTDADQGGQNGGSSGSTGTTVPESTGNDQTGGNQEPEQNQQEPEQPEDQGGNGGNGGGDDQGSGGQGDEPQHEEPVKPTEPGATVTLGSSTGTFYWWNGVEGGWKPVVTYENTWMRHQYLTLEVTRIDDTGKATTTTIKDFYVPANGKSNLEVYDNLLTKKGVGTVAVTVTVTGIRTSDEAWKTISYPGDGTSTTVKAPAIP